MVCNILDELCFDMLSIYEKHQCWILHNSFDKNLGSSDGHHTKREFYDINGLIWNHIIHEQLILLKMLLEIVLKILLKMFCPFCW